MYERHFGLRELPFSLTPDTGFYFAEGPVQEALEMLMVALDAGEGFIKVTGEVGTGKSMVCRKLLNTLDHRFYTAYVPNPGLTPAAVNRALAEELGLELPRNLHKHALYKRIALRLIDLAREGRRTVLCIDEAQAMPLETLEAVRLLTNLETEKRKLLHIVLFGQPELDEQLAQPQARQLRQRITFTYQLRPLDRSAVDRYLHHRLARAGACTDVRFPRRAVRLLHRASGGTPRLLNILAHKSLMAAYGEGSPAPRLRHVRRAIADTEGVKLRRFWPPRLFGAVTCAVAAALPALSVDGLGGGWL